MASNQLQEELYISTLIRGYMAETLSPEQEKQLHLWRNADTRHEQLFIEITSTQHEIAIEALRQVPVSDHLENTFRKLDAIAMKRKRFNHWIYASVAAAIAAAMLMIALTYVPGKKNRVPITGNTRQDVLPGIKKAQLVSDDGSSVNLGSGKDSSFILGGISVKQHNGQLSYTTPNNGHEHVHYNTLTTPKGAEYHILLEDGTNVWLNAASSIRFPSRFSGQQRRVEISGEVYFEVTKNAGLPFIIAVEGHEVQVLGTAFNVKAYPEEPLQTALVHGSVSVSVTAGRQPVLLQPGQLVTVTGTNAFVSAADLSSITAWKEGKFVFHNAPLGEVFVALERWYNVKTVYGEGVNAYSNAFTGTISRNQPISTVLEKMEMVGLAKFSINNDIVTVSPYN